MRLDKSIFPNDKDDKIKFLVENKKELIDLKKSLPIKSDSFAAGTSSIVKKHEFQTKAEIPVQQDPDKLRVRVIANLTGYMDSHDDVLALDAAKKSIIERGPQGKNIIPHLADHEHKISAKLGIVKQINYESFEPAIFGIDTDVDRVQALIFETELERRRNPVVFDDYKDGLINQHSIGLQYTKLFLAVNDKEFKEEFEIWEKYFHTVVNKENALEKGYFWYIPEFKLLENSAVLFGSNEITPTLDNGTKTLKPSADTSGESTKVTQIDYSKLNFKL